MLSWIAFHIELHSLHPLTYSPVKLYVDSENLIFRPQHAQSIIAPFYFSLSFSKHIEIISFLLGIVH